MDKDERVGIDCGSRGVGLGEAGDSSVGKVGQL